jgi:hypothetical protein
MEAVVAPVIRISDEVFRRLQRLSEPLVDTPSSVIERVIEHYEKSPPGGPRPSSVLVREVQTQTVLTEAPGFGLYLVPATKENLRISIRQTVPIAVARESLTPEKFSSLEEAIAPANEFRCWATTDSNKAVFESMKNGDVVLLTEKGTGRFNFRARVRAKVVSEELARRLWPVVPGLPWKYIYLLDDVQPANLKKDCVVENLGYDRSFWVPGHLRVNPEKLAAAIQTHGSFEGFIAACAA